MAGPGEKYGIYDAAERRVTKIADLVSAAIPSGSDTERDA